MMTTVDSETPLRAHDRQRRCDHKLVDSRICVRCGWRPPADNTLAQLMDLWDRTSFEDRRTFLLRVRFS